MFAVSAITLALMAPLVAPAPIVEPPVGGVSLEVLAVAGSGCARDDVIVELSLDNASVIVSVGAYTARAGGGASPVEFRKNCQIGMYLGGPPLYSFAIARVDYRGLAHVASGATASMRGNFYWAGLGTSYVHTHPFTSPIDGSWTWSYEVDSAALAWSPCGERRFVSLSTELRVNRGAADPQMLNSISFLAPEQGPGAEYHLVWRACPLPV